MTKLPYSQPSAELRQSVSNHSSLHANPRPGWRRGGGGGGGHDQKSEIFRKRKRQRERRRKKETERRGRGADAGKDGESNAKHRR